jgi:pyruvate dehydrogenase E2 component (dihydrolipoyllysine-residue acetyltransferase)
MATTDLVMPKLGLTMTEGTVARWDVAPGGRFVAGDIILVVETDKIAYDVEAPGPGILQEVLVTEGNVVPVGTAIGRWDVGDMKVSLDAPEAEARAATPAATAAVAEAPPMRLTPQQTSDGQRILATPFARRLARQGGIDLGALNGSGPRGRIKAADVAAAIDVRASAKRSAAPEAASGAVYRAGVEIDVGALLALNEQINGDLPDLHADLVHYVVLAAAKAADMFHEPAVFGLAQNGWGDAAMVKAFASADCRTLSGVVARIESAPATPPASSHHGTLWIEPAQDGIAFLATDPPRGWSASLTIGAVREAFRPDADGRPVRAGLVQIVLTGRAADLDPKIAQRLLRRLHALLETPLLLLAS